MTIVQPYQRRVGTTLRRQTTMADAMKKRSPKSAPPKDNYMGINFQARQMAKQLREQVPVRQQAHWSRLETEKKIRNAMQREAMLGERRAIEGYKTSLSSIPPHMQVRLRELEAILGSM